MKLKNINKILNKIGLVMIITVDEVGKNGVRKPTKIEVLTMKTALKRAEQNPCDDFAHNLPVGEK